ncbi:MFS transporter [Paraburkholderia sp. C35]|uniref:MFS transporter n=1 Tax=Paraburkholderia sp. C35 TaxID=2126993 RepID=UPI000D688A1F|nr:MFS transporter [Paraburkholderia sp. C35]
MSTNPSIKEQNRWHVLTACFLAYAFDAMDFMLLAVAMPVIIRDFHLPLAMAGLIGTATLIGVGLSSVMVGWYADNYGRKRALIGSLLVFGVFTAAIALSRGWLDMMVMRFLAGLGLGGVWGVAAAFIGETFGPHQRGRAMSLVSSAWPVGFGIAATLARVILPTYGWRVLFLCGFGAIVAAIYTMYFVRESAVWVASREKAGITAQKISIAEIFSDELRWTTIFGTLAATFALVGYWGANTWIPTYLSKERGLSAASMTTFVILLNVGMFVGLQLFGWLSDKIGRVPSLLLSFVGATIMMPLYSLTGSNAVLLWMGPVMALFFSFSGIFGSYFAEIYPLRVRSLGAGFCFNVGRGLSAFAPFVLGALASRTSLATSIALCGAGFALAAVFTIALAVTRRRVPQQLELAIGSAFPESN